MNTLAPPRPGILAFLTRPDIVGILRRKSHSVVDLPDGPHYLSGPCYSDGIAAYPLPSDAELISADDPAAVEAELTANGWRGLGIDWLVRHGYATRVAQESFDRRAPGERSVEYQADYSGRLATGIETTYLIECGRYRAKASIAT